MIISENLLYKIKNKVDISSRKSTEQIERDVTYDKRFEADSLLTNPKGPKMLLSVATKYMKKWFVEKSVIRYKQTKAVDDLPSRGIIRKSWGWNDHAYVFWESSDDFTGKTREIETKR